ncbi:ATP-binding protein [Streptomyces sp. PvR034]|uniref:sensor histidine kinase n=1 Tax=Streptomyces sp. PvR034 TaxID=3156401 RepID=UPI00339B947D
MTVPTGTETTPEGRTRQDRRGPSLQTWLNTVLVALALVVVGTGALGAVLLSHTTTAGNRLVDGILPAQRDALRLETALLDQETGVRGYLLADAPALLEPYERGLVEQRTAVDRLKTVLDGDGDGRGGGDAAEREDLTAVEEAARTWRQEFAEPAIRAVREGTARPSAQSGKDRFDEVRHRIAAQQDRLDTVQAEARTTFSEAREQRDHILLAIIIGLLLAAAGLAVLLHIGVLRPLTRIKTASQRVADGAFDEEIPVAGPSDLRALAGSVEAMRRRTVAELRSSHRNAERLDRTAVELDAQAAELRRSNAELEQFAYVASHDLQEPLRKVASFCQLLEKRYGDQLDERGTQYIGFAVDGAKRMQVLINDLLTYSRVGRVQDGCERVDLDSTLDRALRNLATAIEEGDAEVSRPERLPEVVGDPTLLTMLWQNLVGNAVKFRSPDRPPRVEVAVVDDPAAEPGFAAFAVTDNGIGVPTEFADKVFVIFQRLHSRDAYGGTGIGLSLCKKIVENAGGRIRIDTAHEVGTRIVLTLPVADAPDTAGEGEPAAPATPSEGTDS